MIYERLCMEEVASLRRNVVVYIALNTTAPNAAADYLGAKRAAVDQLVRSCGLRTLKRFVDDLAQLSTDDRDLPPQLKRAVQFAIRKKCALVGHGELSAAVLAKMQARLLDHEIEFFDLERLESERDVLRARSVEALLKGRKRDEAAKKGRAAARANSGRFGSPDMNTARWASAEVQAHTFAIQRREYLKWRAEAVAQGVTTPKALVSWLNARGIPTARGGVWTEANLRRVLKEIEHHEVERIDAPIASESSLGSPRSVGIGEPTVGVTPPPKADTVEEDVEIEEMFADLSRDLAAYKRADVQRTMELDPEWLSELDEIGEPVVEPDQNPEPSVLARSAGSADSDQTVEPEPLSVTLTKVAAIEQTILERVEDVLEDLDLVEDDQPEDLESPQAKRLHALVAILDDVDLDSLDLDCEETFRDETAQN